MIEKSVILGCIEEYKRIDIKAYHDDWSSVYVEVNDDVHVQVSEQEIYFRFDEHRNYHSIWNNEHETRT